MNNPISDAAAAHCSTNAGHIVNWTILDGTATLTCETCDWTHTVDAPRKMSTGKSKPEKGG